MNVKLFDLGVMLKDIVSIIPELLLVNANQDILEMARLTATVSFHARSYLKNNLRGELSPKKFAEI